MLKDIINQSEKYLSPDFILKKKIRILNKIEILNINQNYRLSFFFKIKREIKLFLSYLFSIIARKKINLIASRDVNNVKKKYDDIAGSYVDDIKRENKKCLIQSGNNVLECYGDIKEYYAYCISNIIQNFNSKRVLEVGAGELTQYYLIKKYLDKKKFGLERSCALDLSLKRLEIGKKFLNSKNQNIEIFQGDAQKMPFKENEFDFLYTCHCLEQVPHLFEACLKEMLRVSKKYILLIEPSYELTNIVTRNYIYKKHYIKISDKILNKTLKNISYKRFKMPIFQYIDGAELVIIEKD
tara:strand:+ start:144 stop:1034 length:891 start_codon:yes stop_codon:yes gene_type:complete